jgi:peptidylprolyl isomerase domain and WD repeat-containing protein 1
MIEYWTPHNGEAPPASAGVKFKYKMETDLYDLAKAKAAPVSACITEDGESFAVTSTDQHVRVFSFATGKLRRRYDESIEVFEDAQASGRLKLDQIDFGRRTAVEHELRATVAGQDTIEGYGKLTGAPPSNPVFDESGHFLLYPTLAGIKVVNLVTNKVTKMVGMVESGERFLSVSLFQGIPKIDSQSALRLSKAKGGAGPMMSRGEGEEEKGVNVHVHVVCVCVCVCVCVLAMRALLCSVL